jgi:pheromone shutdown-related protein TraB
MDSEHTHPLTYEDKEVTLIGTAHVSRESTELVGRIIEQEKPDTVCIELCESRYQSITQKKKWQETELIKVIREKKAYVLLSNLMLAYFQKRIGQKLGIRPGEEIIRAIHAAEAVGARIWLADRDIRTTLSRTWRLMSFWRKMKVLVQLVASSGDFDSVSKEDIEMMKTEDVLGMLLSEIGESFPEIRTVLIDERDQYLAHRIRSAPGKRIVAIVGAGHVPGIQRYWRSSIDLAELARMPPKGRFMSLLKWGIPVLIIALIVVGFVFAGASAGTHMIKWWIIANALLAGLGAAVALGHPLSILTAICASPLTSLNPMMAAGWFSGLVEVLVAKPKVRDFEALPEDISTLKGFWRNKIIRVLMVVVFTNIGSSLGAFVAIPLMLRVFA